MKRPSQPSDELKCEPHIHKMSRGDHDDLLKSVFYDSEDEEDDDDDLDDGSISYAFTPAVCHDNKSNYPNRYNYNESIVTIHYSCKCDDPDANKLLAELRENTHYTITMNKKKYNSVVAGLSRRAFDQFFECLVCDPLKHQYRVFVHGLISRYGYARLVTYDNVHSSVLAELDCDQWKMVVGDQRTKSICHKVIPVFVRHVDLDDIDFEAVLTVLRNVVNLSDYGYDSRKIRSDRKRIKDGDFTSDDENYV